MAKQTVGSWMSAMVIGTCMAAGCSAPATRTAAGGATVATGTRARVAFVHALPRLDGSRLAVKIVEVTYPPGGSSAPHRHPCPVIGYVLAGALRMQVQGEPETTYTAGQSFFEAPGAVHLISANASADQPARFLAYFTCDNDGSRALRSPDKTTKTRAGTAVADTGADPST